MSKQEFISTLKRKLSGLPRHEIEDRIRFYSEMIDDRIEDGIPERVAVAGVGSPSAIAAQIITEVPLTRIVRERERPEGRMSALTIVLLVLGFPIWFSLGVALFAVAISLYVALWSIVISLWAAALSAAVCVPAGILCGSVFIIGGNALSGAALFGAALVCFGLSVFMLLGCKWVSKATVYVTKWTVLKIIGRG